MSVGRPPLEPGTHGEPWVRQTAHGYTATVYLREVGGGRRRISRSARTPKEARAKALDAARKEAATTSGAGVMTGAMRFADAAEVWLDHKRAAGVQDSSIGHYRVRLSAILPVMGQLRLREVTSARIRVAFDRLAEGRAVSTLRAYRVVVDGVMRLAAQYDAVPSGTVAADALGGRRHARKMPRSLTRAEATTIVAALRRDEQAPPFLADLVLLQVGTGLRIGEALGLRWGSVDVSTDRPHAVIDGNVVSISGRGVVRHDGKTAAAIRTVTLPPFVVAMLRERRPAVVAPEWPVFPGADGGWLRPEIVTRSLRGALDRAGWQWVTSHVFRKTAATLLDDAGVPLRQIADQLGHASTRITADVYLGRKLDPDAAADALERAWRGDDGER